MINKLKTKPTLLNTISGVFLQLCNVLFAFVVPKLILSYFGSEVNGMVSSISNFLLYISLFEAGLSNVIMANLYKPLVNNDYNKVSKIIKTSNRFYHKIGVFFIIYTLVLGIIYPLMFNNSFSFVYIITLIIIMSINLYVQYNFSYSLRTLLRADKKVYIVNFTQSIIIVLNIIFSVVSLIIYPNIHFFKLVSGIVYIIQPVIFNYYIKKHYKIDKDVEYDEKLLKSRWDSLAISIATFVHNSVDIALLTIFTNFKIVSIYSVYYLVISGLEAVFLSVSNSIAPTFGKILAKNSNQEMNEKFETYEYMYTFIVFLVFSVAGLLITPFVTIYTGNIIDANYYQPIFGYIIIISEAIYLMKMPHLNIAYSANLFKKITIPAYIEAIINIIVSVILVNFLGLIGVAIGTLVAMTFRTIFQIHLLKNNAIYRQPIIFWKKVITFLVGSIIGIILCLLITPGFNFTIMEWIFYSIFYLIIVFFIYLFLSILFYKDSIKKIMKYIKK